MQNNLKSIRLSKGLTQKEVATMLGFKSEDRICRWEKGNAMPNVKNLLMLGKIYNVAADQLYKINKELSIL